MVELIKLLVALVDLVVVPAEMVEEVVQVFLVKVLVEAAKVEEEVVQEKWEIQTVKV